MRTPRLAIVILTTVWLAAPVGADPKPATTPTTAPAATTAGCTVRVKSAKVDVVVLHPRNAHPAPPPSSPDNDLFTGLRDDPKPGGDEQQTDQKFLVLRIEVTNAGNKKCTYHALNGSDAKCPTMAILRDDAQHVYALAEFGDLEVKGAVRGARVLGPGEPVTDVIVFEVPPKKAKGLRLLVPQENVGSAQRVEPLPVSPER